MNEDFCDNFVKSVIEADRSELVDSFWFVNFRHEAIRVKFQSSRIFLVIKTSLMELMKEGSTMSQCLWKKIGLKLLGLGTLVGLNENKASLTSPLVTSPEIESWM